MAGRFGYFMIGGAAIVAGMAVQGDLDFGDDEVVVHRAEKSDRGDRKLDRRIDRIVDRATAEIDVRDGDGRAIETDPAMRRALVGAVAELVRAEVSLATTKRDEDLPDAAVAQAEQRRDRARQAVERLADDARANSRSERDTLRQTIRDDVRETVREAVRN